MKQAGTETCIIENVNLIVEILIKHNDNRYKNAIYTYIIWFKYGMKLLIIFTKCMNMFTWLSLLKCYHTCTFCINGRSYAPHSSPIPHPFPEKFLGRRWSSHGWATSCFGVPSLIMPLLDWRLKIILIASICFRIKTFVKIGPGAEAFEKHWLVLRYYTYYFSDISHL